MSWKDLVRQELRSAAAYHVPSYPNAIKLDANESPFALSAAAEESLAKALRKSDLHRYPDAAARDLREVLSRHLGVAGDEICLGNGSDELLGLLCAAFGEPRGPKNKVAARASILYPAPGFVVFRTAAISHGLDVVEVPFADKFAPDDNALLEAVAREKPNLIFLATPNNPTGTVWPRETIAKLLVQFPDVITVVDEAYLAYGDARSCSDLALAHSHCVCLGTLSKIGLAGLRVGYLIGKKEVVAEVEKVRPPYNLSTLAQRAATLILREHHPELQAHFALVKAERARLYEALNAFADVEVFPSGANFLLIRVVEARKLFEGLAERGVVVRCFDRGLLKGCLRVTVGTPDENSWLLDAMKAYFGAR
jgi:histidinol-phosphate aminotransferase